MQPMSQTKIAVIVSTSTEGDIRSLIATTYWNGEYKLARALERRGARLDKDDEMLCYTLMRTAQERHEKPLIRGLHIRQQVPYVL